VTRHDSPLELIVRDERVNRIVRRIRDSLDRSEPLESLGIALSPNEIRGIQTAFHEALRTGEHTLYRFVRSLAEMYYPGKPVEVEATVLARPVRRPREVAFIQRRLRMEEVLGVRDHALAARILDEITGGKRTLRVAASSLRWFPSGGAPPGSAVLEIVSRVKATEDICSKIADEIFRLSEAFRRDKITNRLSRYLKDIYGAKVVCATVPDCYRVSREIQEREDVTSLEVKDYIERPKASGFQCLKLVVLHHGVPLEAQILTQEMRTREMMFPETSHRTYKEKRERLRERLGPEYRRCYEFLRELFEHPDPTTRHPHRAEEE
jgi:hypothetical protein